jgi:16S rRNA (guanine966-N2)-methyltransferase
MLRIIAGKFRSRLIHTPTTVSTRPTKDRVREAIFSALGPAIEGARILDLFAGSGAFAFESMSRGAAHVTCIDNHFEVFTILKKNKALLSLTDEECVVAYGDFKKHIKRCTENSTQFDIIFLDPPYGQSLEIKAFQLIFEHSILSANGIIVVESDYIPQMEDPSVLKTKVYDYGSTQVKIYWRST